MGRGAEGIFLSRTATKAADTTEAASASTSPKLRKPVARESSGVVFYPPSDRRAPPLPMREPSRVSPSSHPRGNLHDLSPVRLPPRCWVRPASERYTSPCMVSLPVSRAPARTL